MMGPAEAIGTCLNRYAGFSGRARPSEFWWFAGFVALGVAAFGVLDGALGFEPLATLPERVQPRDGVVPLFEYQAPGPIAGGFLAAMLLPLVAAAVRRLHDRGMDGWWLVAVILPVAGWIVLATFLALGGDEEENPHGLPPGVATGG